MPPAPKLRNGRAPLRNRAVSNLIEFAAQSRRQILNEVAGEMGSTQFRSIRPRSARSIK